MARCPICYTLIQPGAEQAECADCRQEYHRGCWDELGGCATYGCAEAVLGEKPAPTAGTQEGWGDTKDCPSCGSDLGSSLLICSCGAKFPYADPMTSEQYITWFKEQANLSSTRRALVVLFIVTLLGVPAPVTGITAGVYAYRNRDRLAGNDGTYLAMGYGAAAVGLTYALILIALMAGL